MLALLQEIKTLKQFKFAANLKKDANKLHRFLYISIIMDPACLFITYLLITSVYGFC